MSPCHFHSAAWANQLRFHFQAASCFPYQDGRGCWQLELAWNLSMAEQTWWVYWICICSWLRPCSFNYTHTHQHVLHFFSLSPSLLPPEADCLCKACFIFAYPEHFSLIALLCCVSSGNAPFGQKQTTNWTTTRKYMLQIDGVITFKKQANCHLSRCKYIIFSTHLEKSQICPRYGKCFPNYGTSVEHSEELQSWMPRRERQPTNPLWPSPRAKKGEGKTRDRQKDKVEIRRLGWLLVV